MKRTVKKEKATAILMSDVHLRLNTPVCRTDEEFLAAQWGKLQFIKDLQIEHDCIVFCGGDLFHHWKPAPELITKTMEHLPAKFYTIYGQHDLPNHSLKEQDKSGIYALKTAGALTLLPGCHWGQDPKDIPPLTLGNNDVSKKVLVWHKMNYQGKLPWPGCTDPKAVGLLRKYPEYDLILTGDNHKPFIEEYGGKILVNPGSLMRQTADQIDFKPRVYLYYAATNSVEPVFLPIKAGVVNREHLERDSQRSERIDAFISKLDGEWQAGMSFEANLEKFFKTNEIRTSVKEIIYKAIES